MKHIKNTSDIVKHILEEVPGTRNDDDLLYCKVLECVNEECVKMPLHVFLKLRKHYKLPPFESVRRSRQKIQAAYPWLRANDTVEGYRAVNEEIVKKYARSVSV